MNAKANFGLVVLLVITALPAHADTKIIFSEATYIMGDGETPSFAEAMAIQKAKQIALEQAGTYLESYTKVQNYQLTEEEIQTIAGGVLQVEIIQRKRELHGDAMHHFVKIKATVTTDKIQDLAQRIKDRNVSKEYKALQEVYTRLNKEIESLKQHIAKNSSGPDREATIEQIRDRERAFASVQKRESAFFQRLVSGGELFAKASAQLNRMQKDDAIIDALFEEILQRGHIIEIGEPEVEAEFESRDYLNMRVPISVAVNREIEPYIKKAHKNLGGEVAYAVLQSIEKRLSTLVFSLEVVVANRPPYVCHASQAQSEELRKIDTDTEFLFTDKEATHFKVSLRLPTKNVKEVTALRGKFMFGSPGKECNIRFTSASLH